MPIIVNGSTMNNSDVADEQRRDEMKVLDPVAYFTVYMKRSHLRNALAPHGWITQKVFIPNQLSRMHSDTEKRETSSAEPLLVISI